MSNHARLLFLPVEKPAVSVYAFSRTRILKERIQCVPNPFLQTPVKNKTGLSANGITRELQEPILAAHQETAGDIPSLSAV